MKDFKKHFNKKSKILEAPSNFNSTSISVPCKINGNKALIKITTNYIDITSRAFHWDNSYNMMHNVRQKIKGKIDLEFSELENIIEDTKGVKVKIKGFKKFKADLKVTAFSSEHLIDNYTKSEGVLYLK